MKKVGDIVRGKITASCDNSEELLLVAEHWNEISGPTLSRYSFPVRLSNNTSGRMLTVVLFNQNFAVEMHHTSSDIEHSVSLLLGDNNVKIRVCSKHARFMEPVGNT